MEKDSQQNLEIQLFSFPTLNPAISSAVQGIKSFSPGEVFEFLQNRFPLQSLKSKAHAKTASALIEILNQLLDSDDLKKSESSQVKLYAKTLQSFVVEFEETLSEEVKPSPKSAPAPKAVQFADTLINRLKNSAETERKNIFGRIAKTAEKDEVVDAKFRKLKKR